MRQKDIERQKHNLELAKTLASRREDSAELMHGVEERAQAEGFRQEQIATKVPESTRKVIDSKMEEVDGFYHDGGRAMTGKFIAGTFSTPLDITLTPANRGYGMEIHWFGDDASVTGLRSRAQLKTSEASTRTAQGAVIQAANNNGISVGVLNGALIEAIGKSDISASTITMMRGALINTEWNAKETITDLRILHVRTHTRNAATEGYISGSSYGIYIENEAVGGNGQVLDAGIYLKQTNISGGNKAFTYGIDMTGAQGYINTADIRLQYGETIGNTVNGRIDSTATTSYFSGNVGIGTTGPSVTLDIESSINANSTVHISNTSNTGYSGIDIRDDGDVLVGSVLYSNSGATANPSSLWIASRTSVPLHFGTNGYGPDVTIDTNGNVGIGTTGPDRKLDVLDASNPQIRTTHTDNSKFTDFKTDGSGDLSIYGNGDTTNYFELKADGEVNLYGTARVVRHIRVTAPSWKQGAEAPTENRVGIFPTWGFDATHDDEVYYSLIIPYRMAVGTTITVKIEWTYTGGQDDGTVCWNVDYINVATDETVDGSVTTISKTTAGSHLTGKMQETTLDVGITGAVAHDCLGLRLWRDFSADTLATNAELIQVHFHMIMDKLGQAT